MVRFQACVHSLFGILFPAFNQKNDEGNIKSGKKITIVVFIFAVAVICTVPCSREL